MAPDPASPIPRGNGNGNGGSLFRRTLSDGMELSCWPMPGGGAILLVGLAGSDDHREGWSFTSPAVAMMEFVGCDLPDHEPAGWTDHSSGRHREQGDAKRQSMTAPHPESLHLAAGDGALAAELAAVTDDRDQLSWLVDALVRVLQARNLNRRSGPR